MADKQTQKTQQCRSKNMRFINGAEQDENQCQDLFRKRGERKGL